MGKDKPRHNPHKKQHHYLGWLGECQYCEVYYEGNEKHFYCPIYGYATEYCKGDPYKCRKALYRLAASRSDVQKNNNVEPKPKRW